MRMNSILLAAACTLPFSLVACGGGDDGSSNNGDDDGGSGNVTPTGDHHQYVVNKATVISNPPEAISLDFGSATSSKADGKVDNRLGKALSSLSSFFDIQGAITLAINDGSLNLLLDVQTTDFTNNTAGAGFSVKFGENPMPAACTDPADPTTCGQQLKGGASFTVSADSPANASLAGTVTNGTFNAGPGNVGLQIAIGTTTISLSLVHARAKITGMTTDGISNIIVGGLVTVSDLNTQVGPAIKSAVDNILATDCTGTPKTPANKCGCPAGGTGEKVINLLDGDLAPADKDCVISVDEILKAPVIAAVLTPDSCSQDTCTAADSLSIGVQVQAVKATF